MSYSTDFTLENAHRYAISPSYTGRLPSEYINQRSARNDERELPSSEEYDDAYYATKSYSFLPINMMKKPEGYEYCLVPVISANDIYDSDLTTYQDNNWTLVPKSRHLEYRSTNKEIRRLINGLKSSHFNRSKQHNITEEDIRMADELQENCILYKGMVLMEREKFHGDRERRAVAKREQYHVQKNSAEAVNNAYKNSMYKVKMEVF